MAKESVSVGQFDKDNLGQSSGQAEELKEMMEDGRKIINAASDAAKQGKPLGDGGKVDVSVFSGLPLGLLICQPFIEVSKGQQALIDVYLDTIEKLAFDNNNAQSGESTEKSARTLDFTLERPVQQQDGSLTTQKEKISAPLLSLVPVPALLIDDVSVNFSVEIKSQEIDEKNNDTKGTTSAGYKGWGFSANITGEVSSSTRTQRTTDSSARYDISVRASQQPSTEGMNKLAEILASSIQPIKVQ